MYNVNYNVLDSRRYSETQANISDAFFQYLMIPFVREDLLHLGNEINGSVEVANEINREDLTDRVTLDKLNEMDDQVQSTIFY
jgi:hypothetical protein